MISGHATVTTAVQAVKQGAFDFLEKPLDSDRLLVTVQRALDTRLLAGENSRLRRRARARHRLRFAMVGTSEGSQDSGAGRPRAPTNARVLICGENASGKELVARAIHEGRRASAAVRGGQLRRDPTRWWKATVWPHEGIVHWRPGDQAGSSRRPTAARSFSTNIGDLALNAQAKILRALQEG